MKIKIKKDWQLDSLVNQSQYESMYDDSLTDNDGFWNKQGNRINWKKNKIK